jgi:hypothetical protein
MQLQAEIIQFPKRDTGTADGPRFIAWRYDRGELSIHVEGFCEQTDGEMLLSWSPEVGVEIGEPTVLALSGEPSMLLFNGRFEEHRELFSTVWTKQAEENERLAIFDDDGLAGLARLPKLPQPPLPPIDEARTAHANTVLEEARARIAELGPESCLTLDGCYEILADVEAEMGKETIPTCDAIVP